MCPKLLRLGLGRFTAIFEYNVSDAGQKLVIDYSSELPQHLGNSWAVIGMFGSHIDEGLHAYQTSIIFDIIERERNMEVGVLLLLS